jgi:protein phosphatase 1L
MIGYILEDQGMRPYMEDTHIVRLNVYQNYHLYAIFDGHGTGDISKFLRSYYADILQEKFKELPTAEVETILYESFKTAHNLLPHILAQNAGTTALVVLQKDDMYWVANIGDCRAIMKRNGNAFQITHDHKPDTEKEFARIQALGGFVMRDPGGVARVFGRLAISRSFGDLDLAPYVTWEPEVYRVKSDGGILLMASDGVWDVIQNDEAIAIMSENLPLHARARKILRLARFRGSGDNITIIVVI